MYETCRLASGRESSVPWWAKEMLLQSALVLSLLHEEYIQRSQRGLICTAVMYVGAEAKNDCRVACGGGK